MATDGTFSSSARFHAASGTRSASVVHEPDDAACVARAQQGDRAAFTTLVRRYQNPVYRFIVRMVGSHDEALELAQRQRARRGDSPSLLAELSGLYAMEHGDSAEVLALRAARHAPDDPTVQFRAATTLETIGEREKALVLLGRAIQHGYSVRQIGSERFLAELRKDPRYEFLMKSVGPPAVDCGRMH